MKNQSLALAFFAFSLLPFALKSQEAASFQIAFEGKATRFTPKMPPQSPIPGAPKPFYSYHWEFGDGNFSCDEKPLYPYASAGSHDVYMAATAGYDDDISPPGIIATVASASGLVASSAPIFQYTFDKNGSAIALKNNHDPRPNEEMVIVFSYQNTTQTATDGQLFLFLNEKNYPKKHFEFGSARAHFGEVSSETGLSFLEKMEESGRSSLADLGFFKNELPYSIAAFLPKTTEDDGPSGMDWVQNARKYYQTELFWKFEKLGASQKRNLFITLRGTPEMLKDTSAIIHAKAVFVPTNPAVAPAVFTLEMPIVASHDPNLIAVSDSRVNFRRIRSEKLDYKVRFQNNGEGPASRVELTVDIPEGLKMEKMRPVEWSPKCPICAEKGPKSGCLDTSSLGSRLVFTFHDIYLPGSRQLGVRDRDSTKGFVKYRIEPKRGIAKRPFRSQAHIVFDKNPPISTNFSKTRFKTGFSPGLKIGAETPLDDFSKRSWFIGASASPFKSWRAYPQIELLVGRSASDNGDGSTTFDTTTIFSNADFRRDSVSIRSFTFTQTASRLEIPVLLRKNCSSFFGLGLGASARFVQSNRQTDEKTTTQILNYQLKQTSGGVFQLQWDGKTNETVSQKTAPAKTNKTLFAVFGDLSFGAVRRGPNLGLRVGGAFDDGFQPFAQAILEFKF